MRVVLDVEADNLFPFITKIHCVSRLDLDTSDMKTVTDPSQLDTSEWTTVIGHNVLGYDVWALLKCWGIDLSKVEIIDTLAWSRYLWPDRPWGHSLADWGEHLGMPKGEHNDFTQYSEAMKTYCEHDVCICAAIYKYLLEERNRR